MNVFEEFEEVTEFEVTDQEVYDDIVEYYGTDFEEIADKMKDKEMMLHYEKFFDKIEFEVRADCPFGGVSTCGYRLVEDWTITEEQYLEDDSSKILNDLQESMNVALASHILHTHTLKAEG